MHAEEARPTRATKQIRSRTEWGNASDKELIAGLLGKNDFAYLEFLSRFHDVIENRVGATIRRFSDALCTEETIDDVAFSVESMMTDHRETLRAFDSEKGTLADWVARVAQQATLKHLDELTTAPTRELKSSDNQETTMTNETTKNEKPIPSLAELLTINHEQDTIADLLAIAKMQARTIERLTTPSPSLPTVVAEWMPMVSALMEMFARRPTETMARGAQPPLHVVDATAVDTTAENAA